MGISVQRKSRAVVARHAGERLGDHAAGEGVDSEGVPQIVDVDIGQARPLEQRVHVAAGRAGIDGHRVGEDPPTDGIRLVPPQDVGHAPGQMVRIPVSPVVYSLFRSFRQSYTIFDCFSINRVHGIMGKTGEEGLYEDAGTLRNGLLAVLCRKA